MKVVFQHMFPFFDCERFYVVHEGDKGIFGRGLKEAIALIREKVVAVFEFM
ncbi:MAG: hypothetical protein HEP71_25975 [Roseivirga sp.]|nr:hypothetical protein [Roseivirga sp.]